MLELLHENFNKPTQNTLEALEVSTFMSLMLIGISHKRAPIKVRENFSLHKNELPEALNYMLSRYNLTESFFVSTCNRTELYAFCEEKDDLIQCFSSFFNEYKSIPLKYLHKEMFYIKEGEEVVSHLFRVASGLDSSVIGETQVLGQIKEYFQLCQENNAVGTYLNKLGQKALAAGKKVHTKTAVGQHAISFGYASSEIAQSTFSSLKDQTLIVVGTGEMAKLTLKNIFDLGIKEVIVASSYQKRAEKLAERFKGKKINLTEIDQGLKTADIVICATNAPHYVITKERLNKILEIQRSKPLLIIDLGLPRNVEPAVAKQEGICLYNLDHINYIIQENLKTRKKEAYEAEKIVKQETVDFMYWYNHRHAAPLIKELQNKTEKIRLKKLEQFKNQFSSLNLKEKELIEKLTRSIVNELLKEPISNIKDLCSQNNDGNIEKYTSLLFGLDKEKLKEKKEKD